jgi:hypothetical protein
MYAKILIIFYDTQKIPLQNMEYNVPHGKDATRNASEEY